MITALLTWMHAALPVAIVVAFVAPGITSVLLGLFTLATGHTPTEKAIVRVAEAALVVSLLAAVCAAMGAIDTREVNLGSFIAIADYEVPLLFLVDDVALSFSILAAALTAVIARFSKTYLHKDKGFLRFYVLLGLFSSGAQLVSFSGALDLMFLGWELMGLSSTLFIGFFYERAEPVRSSLRAFVTYRVCDAGFLFGIVATHELLGSTKLSVIQSQTAHTLSPAATTTLALCFLLAACGKSAQLPFSGWLPRAMEGPTPSSALFYGGVSVHAGLFLMLRLWPIIALSTVAVTLGTIIGVATAIYATLVARTTTDAKGALAHATLAQVGLILAEICLGWTSLAMAHLLGHVLLRVWQYLRAPNTIHDAHRTHRTPSLASPVSRRLFAWALSRFRLDDGIDVVVGGVLAIARAVDRWTFRSLRPQPHRYETAVVGGLLVVVAAMCAASVVVGTSVPGAHSTLLFQFGAAVALVGGLCSMVQGTLRGLFRTKVTVHFGFLMCAMASEHDGTLLFAALTGALSMGGVAFVMSAVERRCGQVSLVVHGGRMSSFPHLGGAFAFLGAAGVGLPATAGFVADDLLLHAAWQQSEAVSVALIVATVFAAAGTLRGWQRVFLGAPTRSAAGDLNLPERAVVVTIVMILVIAGIVPSIVLNKST